MANDSKAIGRAKDGKTIRQIAAIPFRVAADGGIEILLVTSRGTQRFLVPKGWPVKGKSARKAAEIEAREFGGRLRASACDGLSACRRQRKRGLEGSREAPAGMALPAGCGDLDR
ncbi:hypothetical protein ACSBOB_06460 [Mesorhizobium sp. ASY16-5R]|uniref:hypothetical protein n=1 Tax=Mesorhizobium sp. ASY16-5R TaxID=3445772 RepID=UPI003F9F1D2A